MQNITAEKTDEEIRNMFTIFELYTDEDDRLGRKLKQWIKSQGYTAHIHDKNGPYYEEKYGYPCMALMDDDTAIWIKNSTFKKMITEAKRHIAELHEEY